MNAFTVDRTYDDTHKIVSYVPTFNTSSKLEFNILPDKRFLLLNETVLKFGVEILLGKVYESVKILKINKLTDAD